MSEPTLAADLVAFLRARLEEDEQAARAAIKPEAMYPWGDTSLPQMPVESWPDAVRGYLGGTWAEHCARHDPVRVLRDIEAKRLIIDEHHPVDPCDAHDASLRSVPCDTLLLLTLPYADHPDCRETWTP